MIYDITKEAGFISGFLNTIKDQVNFRTKPFETIFGVFGTALSWRFGWLIGGFVTAAQLFGYGPGEIGKLIDSYFFGQGAKTIDDFNLSESNVKGASDHAAGILAKVIPNDGNEIINKIKGVFSSNIHDIKEIKGHITNNDKKTAFYAAGCSVGIVKTANLLHTLKFLKLWRRGNRMNLGSGILMKILWAFVKGLLALGIGGGVASMVGLKDRDMKGKGPTTEVKAPDMRPGSGNVGKRPAGLKHYSNVNKNVKQTLITFLNATIANFSAGFMQAQRIANPDKPPISVERAPGWSKITGTIQKYNWAPITKVNGFSAFVAPNVGEIAKVLLNSVNVSGVKIEKIEPKKSIPTKPMSKLEI